MPGSVIQLPGTGDPATDPFSGYQFVIQPGDDGWMSTDGTPYWISCMAAPSTLSMYHLLHNTAVMRKDLMYHFAEEWPTYEFPSVTKDEMKIVWSWDSRPMTIEMQAVHVSSFRAAENLIDLTITQTDNPNQNGVINIIRANFSNHGASNPGNSSIPGLYSNYDIEISISDEFFQSAESNVALKEDFLSYYSDLAYHEFGHSLGLGHTFGNLKLPGNEDTRLNSRMSYATSDPSYSINGIAPVFTDMDTAALQFLYGPSKKVRTGNDTYVLDATKANWLWDGVGTDTIDASSLNAPLTISLQPGYWGYIGSQRGYGITAPGSVTVNYGSTFENITGSSFADTFTGNELDLIYS